MPEDYDDDSSRAEEENLEELGELGEARNESSPPNFDAFLMLAWANEFQGIMIRSAAARECDRQATPSDLERERFARGGRIVLNSILGTYWDFDPRRDADVYDVGGLLVATFRSIHSGKVNIALDYSTPSHSWKVFVDGYVDSFCSDSLPTTDLMSIRTHQVINDSVYVAIGSGPRIRYRTLDRSQRPTRTHPSEATDTVFRADIKGD